MGSDELTKGQGSKEKSQALGGLIATLLVTLVLILLFSRETTPIRNFIHSSGWVGVLVSVALYGLLGASPVPSEPLTIFLASIYGPLHTTFIAAFGNLAAAMVEFYIGLRISHIANFEERKEKLPFNLGKLPVDSPIFLIAARMLPGYGPKFVSVIAGVYRVPVWRYLWTAALSNLVGAGLVAFGGFGLIKLWKR